MDKSFVGLHKKLSRLSRIMFDRLGGKEIKGDVRTFYPIDHDTRTMSVYIYFYFSDLINVLEY